MMPLALLAAGDKAEVLDIKDGHRHHACCDATQEKSAHVIRTEALGLRAGKTVEMLNNEGGGPMLIKVDESRIAIGHGLAMKIMVRRKD